MSDHENGTADRIRQQLMNMLPPAIRKAEELHCREIELGCNSFIHADSIGACPRCHKRHCVLCNWRNCPHCNYQFDPPKAGQIKGSI